MSATELHKRTSIGKQGLSLRRSARSRVSKPQLAVRQLSDDAHTKSEHYTQRVLAGEFEPTALRARRIATDQGVTLHELAHKLGYAGEPPRTRSQPRLASLTRSELATATGYHISDISRLFARKHPPTLTKLAKVAAAYEAWMDDVLTELGW